MVPVGAAAVCADPGAILCVAVDQAGQAGAVESGEVFGRAGIYRLELPDPGAAVPSDGSVSELAEYVLLPGRGGRDVPEPSGAERLHQAGAGARGRVCDGNLVPVDQHWRVAGGEGGVLFQLDAAAEAVRDQRGYPIY